MIFHEGHLKDASTISQKQNFIGQSQQTYMYAIQWTNQNSKQIHAAGAKRGKTRASKSRHWKEL